MSKRKKLKRVLTWANMLTMSRIFMTIPLVMTLDKGSGWIVDDSLRYWVCFGILIAIFLSDFLDGPLARWTDQVTNVGKVLDPVADKICMMTALIYLIGEYQTPFLLFFILVTMRDTILITVGIYLLQFQDEVFESLMSGKFFMFFAVIMMISYIFPLPDKYLLIREILYVITIFFFIVSSYFYFDNYRDSFNRNDDARII